MSKPIVVPPTDYEEVFIPFCEMTPYQCVQVLKYGLMWCASVGTPDYLLLSESCRKQFEEKLKEQVPELRCNAFYDAMEQAKFQALRLGIHLSDDVLNEYSWGRVAIGIALPQVDRDRLIRLAYEVNALSVRRCPLVEINNKPNAKKKRQPSAIRNEARDKWVASQRAKREPTPWEELYDTCALLAKKKGWIMPNSWKGLSEAHSRYLKRQRNKVKT